MRSVLIIEDDQNIAELERDYLQLNGCKVDIALDGADGLKKALSGMYDILIVDLMLPQKDGFEIIREVRKHQEIPIMVVSARYDDIDKIRGLEFGADDYLTKPFSPAELMARIKSHIRRYERLRGKNTTPEIISHRGLEINTSSHKVFVNGKQVQFTTREYELLLFFAANPNTVFTKDHLFTTIWGDDYVGDTATVAVHIQKLRKKIEKDPSSPEYIETIWGTGYRFNP
jgi:Response regulators consisting of a CheY-like receiver domain and a winged-helix DNA-binding domain